MFEMAVYMATAKSEVVPYAAGICHGRQVLPRGDAGWRSRPPGNAASRMQQPYGCQPEHELSRLSPTAALFAPARPPRRPARPLNLLVFAKPFAILQPNRSAYVLYECCLEFELRFGADALRPRGVEQRVWQAGIVGAGGVVVAVVAAAAAVGVAGREGEL